MSFNIYIYTGRLGDNIVGGKLTSKASYCWGLNRK